MRWSNLGQWLHLGKLVLSGQALFKHSYLYLDFMVETPTFLKNDLQPLNSGGNLQENLKFETLSTQMSRNGLIARVVSDGL